MKKVIITGANGFIGTALCRELSTKNIQVTAIVRDQESNIDNIRKIPGISIVYCELSKYEKLPQLIRDRKFDVFYHLAWVGNAGKLRGDSNVQINNIKYTCDAVKASAEIECKKFVFASSIMEYEISAVMETNNIPNINTLYSSAKIAANYMSRTLAGALGIDYIRAVVSNTYGPGEKSPRLINTSIRKLLNGEHCAFSAGEQMYDFIYIDDVAKAFAVIAEKGKSNKTYYIGSQTPKPLKHFLLELKDQINSGIEIGLGELPFDGISLSYTEFDIDAVKNDTGFEAKVKFNEGICRTIKWIKEGN